MLSPKSAACMSALPASLVQAWCALTAAPHAYTVDGEPVQGFAYNGQVPGPTLRAPVGGTLRVELTNAVDAPTTIHWHGPRDVPFPMDGVAWMGAPVEPGASFVYEIPLTHAGTFWYVRSVRGTFSYSAGPACGPEKRRRVTLSGKQLI